ncbi:AraC family transcriptional regulator [Actimicrobium sp. CCI2.3]|uniref:AraC family transcriptional regulator n=1 Tax=Actimicrobium sp. CCI2.3 TaxID=3048616 RepID=UPI002AB3BC1B|nr:AraC family transcriptional regulator ligand-binding domain-containing protein [Actimicrobium sp. CCI2.3]MDY7576478.1 AraC family transcriptional regulator ligand-binding domain-containing protein [Actimicrobium sp. CCI2.3]MEB0021544.1 AraC family transcriptional regulator ligand-binding domain-containing protein [Actimicrobium sp. CCI2.3]
MPANAAGFRATMLTPPIYARQLRMLLQQGAIDGDQVLAAAQLDWATLLTDDRRLSQDTVTRLVTSAMTATGKPWLGLDLAASLPVTAHGALGIAAVTARDIAGLLVVLERYSSLRNAAFSWELQITPQGAVLQATEQADWGEARGFVLDMMVGAVLHLIAAALGQLPAGLRVEMPIAAPQWVAQYRRYLPVEISFGRSALAFHVDRQACSLACLGADRHGHAVACAECDDALAEQAGRSIAQQVTALLAVAPAGRYPQLVEVASALGLTPRTLMRRLHADHATFQQLLDAARQTRTLWLLQHSRCSIEEIAAQLGYADTSNFSRTVRRWFGVTPLGLRQRDC